MFNLAGIEDIKSAIDGAQKKSRNSQINFYASVASKVTTYFRSVWKEHGDLKFELKPDGDQLVPGVVEHNRYDFSKRSDGFKRFVTFLLMVSAVVRSGKLSNTVLLIDEPDISLHPSGARFLRDELIRISRSNDVVYSTHSMFMIDGEDIARHIIVEKKNEQTNIVTATESNIVREEVIYNALGFSIFETLKPKNILFEGWRDKRLYDIATKKLPAGMAGVKEKLKSVGSCHAMGVKDIRSVTPLLQLAARQCLIVSDGDAPAREKQKEYAKFRVKSQFCCKSDS